MPVRRIAPNVSSYLSEDEEEPRNAKHIDDEVFEAEDEDEAPARSSVVQVGWAAAKKAAAKASKDYASDFKFAEQVQLIKFVSTEPMTFDQHWVNRSGKRSFVCLGTAQCPLCKRGNRAESKFAFSVVNLSDEEPSVQLMTVGIRLCNQLEKLDSDSKTGPLDRLYWAVSKSGQGTKTSYSIMPVKERDLADDWELDSTDVAEFLKSVKPLGTDALRLSSLEELKDIAREMPDED